MLSCFCCFRHVILIYGYNPVYCRVDGLIVDELTGCSLTHQHLSNWLHMDEEFVTIVEVTSRDTNIIQIHFEVMWDEETDMASAIYHVQYLMVKGRCQINYQVGRPIVVIAPSMS